jgi:hypothetical protein
MNRKNTWIAVLCDTALTTLVSNQPFAGFWGSAIFTA